MKPFRISLKELIILIALSVPIGILLYLNNYNKFNYDTKVKRGFAISENFCENYVFNKISLLNTSDLDLISQKYKNRQLNSGSPLDGNMKILLRSDADTYDITFKGMVDPESRIYEEGNEILKYISALELTIFNNEYKSVKLHLSLIHI